MLSARWISKRQPYWDRLAAMVERSGRGGLSALSHREIQELSLLYRQVAADLASVREDPMARRPAEYLNQLLGRAHNLIYMGGGTQPRGIVVFYRETFPRAFRTHFSYIFAAFGVFLAGAVAGFLACLADPAFQRFFLGPVMSDTIERREMWTHSVLTLKPLASSVIMTNNLSVSFAAFASGITGGVGTVYLLLSNGLLFGVINAACWQAGMLTRLAGFVAPHGVLELPAVFIAGAGGLLVARGLLFPGALPRREALILFGGEGVRLALGIIPVLVVAGIIEGFLSPASLPALAKFAFAGALASLFMLYLTQAGRCKSGVQHMSHPNRGARA